MVHCSVPLFQQNCTAWSAACISVSLGEKERRWEVWTMPSGAALIFRTVICNHMLQRCRGFSWSLLSIIVCVRLFKCLHICEQMISPFEAWLLTWVLAQYRGISEPKKNRQILSENGCFLWWKQDVTLTVCSNQGHDWPMLAAVSSAKLCAS